jgi:hypothetical protein
MGHVARIVEKLRNSDNILVVKPQGKRPLGRPRRARVCVWVYTHLTRNIFISRVYIVDYIYCMSVYIHTYSTYTNNS